MAGRPRAPTTIVDEINTSQSLLDRDINHRELVTITLSARETIDFLASYQLLSNTSTCQRCGNPCSLVSYAQSSDGVRWRCRPCNYTQSIRSRSFFAKSHLTLPQLLDMIYFWSINSENAIISNEVSCDNKHTTLDWCNFIREVCVRWVDEHPAIVGGVRPDGSPIIVEVDETKYFHRKYARGTWHEGHWVVAAIERDNSKNAFLVQVPNKTVDSLLPIIRDHVGMGSMIYSDERSGYRNIGSLPEGYGHKTINHSRNFVEPGTGDHTRTIEGFWTDAKRKVIRMNGSNKHLFDSYLREFEWRWRNDTFPHGGGRAFQKILVCVGEQYPL